MTEKNRKQIRDFPVFLIKGVFGTVLLVTCIPAFMTYLYFFGILPNWMDGVVERHLVLFGILGLPWHFLVIRYLFPVFIILVLIKFFFGWGI